jgi:hypothetical protein
LLINCVLQFNKVIIRQGSSPSLQKQHVTAPDLRAPLDKRRSHGLLILLAEDYLGQRVLFAPTASGGASTIYLWNTAHREVGAAGNGFPFFKSRV